MIEHENEALEDLARRYARAGWAVTDRIPSEIVMEKGTERVKLRLDAAGNAQALGPALPRIIIDGRLRAWAVLLAILAIVYGTAWLLGWLR